MASPKNDAYKPLAERVAADLLNHIIDNQLKDGDRIPNEYELAEELGVGRSTVREAVKILVSKNVLEIRRGAGTFVSDSKKAIDDPLGLGSVEDRNKLALDLINVRLMLEPGIAAMAAKNATDEDVEAISRQCAKVEEMIRAGENHAGEDIEFHRCIAKASKNVVIENLVPIINRSVAVFVNFTSRRLLEETIETHREVCEAIAKRDPDTARYAMELHLIYNRRMIMDIVESSKQKTSDDN